MKLPEANIKTESYGVQGTTSFGISEDDVGILLNILRTKIYKNPILAVCREISCNARDAHREVSENPNNPTTADTPIEIYLPNYAEPTLKIKDFGPGISPDRKDIFVKFGASTKRDSNLETGGFGLGCKTPFAYGQSFTVDTVCDIPAFVYKCLVGNDKPRMRFVYNAYIDESQIGAMDLMRMETTDEPCGTSIILPVKSGDYWSFAETIIECTKHWDVKPNLFGGDPDDRPEYPALKELYRGTGWVMYTEGITYPCAIVDGIEYPIDRYSLSGKTDLHREMLFHGFCMEFGVGELTLTANRDHLHYDEATIQKILDRVDQIAAEIKNKIIDSINQAPTFFAACDLYRNVKSKIKGIVTNLGKLTWNGHKLMTTCNIHDIGPWAKVVGYSANGDHVLVERSNQKLYFNQDDVMLIHNDKTKYLSKHVVLWLLKEHEDIRTIQVIYTPDVPSSSDFKEAVEREGSIDDVKVEYDTALLDLLEPIKYSSIQVPKTKYLPKASGGGSRVILEDGNINGYTLYSEYSRGCHRLKATPAQFPRDEGGVYIMYDYTTRTFFSKSRINREDWVKAKKILGEDIIGLTRRRAEMIADNPNWVPLEDALAKLFAPWLAKMPGDELKTLMEQAKFANRNKMSRFAGRLGEIEDKQSPLIRWAEESEKLEKVVKEYSPALGLYRWFGHNIPDVGSYYGYDPDDGPMVDLYNEIIERYPLISLVSDRLRSTCDHLIEYINLLDKHRADSRVESLIADLSNANPNSVSEVGTDMN
jgi:hypothetical protein